MFYLTYFEYITARPDVQIVQMSKKFLNFCSDGYFEFFSQSVKICNSEHLFLVDLFLTCDWVIFNIGWVVDKYRHWHAHKCLCMVMPLYSKIQVPPGITSCRLMKDNKQQVELTCLLRITWPKDAIDKWNNSDLQCVILSILVEPWIYTFPLLVSGSTFCK